MSIIEAGQDPLKYCQFCGSELKLGICFNQACSQSPSQSFAGDVKITVPEIHGDAHLIPPKFRSTQVDPPKLKVEQMPKCLKCDSQLDLVTIDDHWAWKCLKCKTNQKESIPSRCYCNKCGEELSGIEYIVAQDTGGSCSKCYHKSLMIEKGEAEIKSVIANMGSLQPKSEWIKDRLLGITQAMERHGNAGMKIPREWVAELKQLITLL